MRTYRSSNKVSLIGIPLMLIAALLTGAIIGGLAFFISYQFNFYLICIFPLVMGLLGGAFMLGAARLGKVRNGFIALLFGLLAGVAIIGVYRGAEYYIAYVHDGAMRQAARENRDATDQEVLLQSIPIGLQDMNVDDFVDFNQRLARAGTSITYRGNNIELDENMTWVLWIVEWLLILGGCVVLTYGAAIEPFDERRNRWYGKGEWFANVPYNKKKEFMSLMKDGNFQAAGALMTMGTLPLPYVTIDLEGNDTDADSDWLFKISDVRQGRNGAERTLVTNGLVSQQELQALSNAIPGKRQFSG